MPRIDQLRTLFDPDQVAGTGYYTRGRYWPAHINTAFSQIGRGSWVWAAGTSDTEGSPAFNFNQGINVRILPTNREYAVRVFAVRRASGPGLVIGKIVPTRTADGLSIAGEIVNLGSTARAVPRLRLALQDAPGKEVQFEIVDPPKALLQPGEAARFNTPFPAPVDAATGVAVTFLPP